MRPPRCLPLVVAATLVLGLVAGPPPPPAAAAAPRPTVLVSQIGDRAVAEPDLRLLNRTAPQSLTADGRLVAFVTDSGPSTDDNGVADVYLRDRRAGTTEAVSITPEGRAGDRASTSPSISGDGRFVAFASTASDLVAGDTSGSADAFVRDRATRRTQRANLDSGGGRTGEVHHVQISADGRTLLWQSETGTFVRHLPEGPIWRVTTDPWAVASLSGNGEFVAYARFDGSTPVQRFRLADGGVEVVSRSLGGAPRNGFDPQISATGEIVSFTSDATDIAWTPATGPRRLYAVRVDGRSNTLVADAWVSAHTMAGSGLEYAFTTEDRVLAEDADGQLDVYATTLFGRLDLVSAAHPPTPAGPSRTPYYPELSGDGLVVTVTSSVTGAPRVHAVAPQDVDEAMADVAFWFPRLFGRAMTPTEGAARRAQVLSLSRTGAEVVVDDVRRESFSGTRAGVVRLYLAYFRRPPDLAGYDHWVGQRRAGVSLDAISRAFAGSAEFRSLYGSLTNRQFVERVYHNVLGRPGDATGIAYWTAQLDSGARDRGRVMTGFSESPEYRSNTLVVVDATMLYRVVHGRMPSTAFLDRTERHAEAGLSTTNELFWIAG